MASELKLKTYKIFGRKARLHPECKDGFRGDRKAGLIYGPYVIGGKWMMTAEQASVEGEFCPYCGKR